MAAHLTVYQKVGVQIPQTVLNASITPMVEWLFCKQSVIGSTPIAGFEKTILGSLMVKLVAVNH